MTDAEASFYIREDAEAATYSDIRKRLGLADGKPRRTSRLVFQSKSTRHQLALQDGVSGVLLPEVSSDDADASSNDISEGLKGGNQNTGEGISTSESDSDTASIEGGMHEYDAPGGSGVLYDEVGSDDREELRSYDAKRRNSWYDVDDYDYDYDHTGKSGRKRDRSFS